MDHGAGSRRAHRVVAPRVAPRRDCEDLLGGVPGLCVPALPYRIARVTFTQARAAQANMKATRRHCIEGRDVRVYDGLLPLQDIHSLTAALQAGAFTRTQSARPDTTAFRHWVLSIPMQTATQLPVYQPTLTAAGEFSGETAYKIYRCYCNYAAYGDMLFTHTDCPPGAGELTALWFIAPANGTWNGAAKQCFSIQQRCAGGGESPARKAGVVRRSLRGNVPPNRICFASRFTLAYKLQPLPRSVGDFSSAAKWRRYLRDGPWG